MPPLDKETIVRALALYLPQFHPTPENDEWWGPGFTEWTNVAKARPLFRGHRQPHIPADLGFYDLRLPAVREAQARLARGAGIEGFVYWHYWFGGRRLLEEPFNTVVATGEPDFPFCVAWANQSWTGIWHGDPDRTLIAQTYPGESDHAAHFEALLPAFRDRRYIRVGGKPLVMVYSPTDIPESQRFLALWRSLAHAAGLPGLHIVGFDHHGDWDSSAAGYDGAVATRFLRMLVLSSRNPVLRIRRKLAFHGLHARLPLSSKPVHVYDYRRASEEFVSTEPLAPDAYPCVVSNWDNTPRSGARGSVLQHATPDLFRAQVERAVAQLRDRDYEHRLLIVKSWNEWAEGNYVEPDREWGRAFLDALHAALVES